MWLVNQLLTFTISLEAYLYPQTKTSKTNMMLILCPFKAADTIRYYCFHLTASNHNYLLI